MSSNKSARQELERLFGKKCMIEQLGIRYIPSKERRKIKGYTKYDEYLTFHHIKEKHNGGKSTPENGALIKGYNHRWLHTLPDYQKEQINEALQQYKLALLAKRVEVDEKGNTKEVVEEIPLDFSADDFITLPAFDTDKKPNKKKKFNRAKHKRELQKMIDEELYGDDEDIFGTDEDLVEEEVDYIEEGVEEDMSRIADPRDLMIWKLHNAVKGQAQSVLSNNQLTPEEKKEDFEVIEEFVHYVDNYYDNQKKLADYDRMKAEYDRWQRDLLDDGR